MRALTALLLLAPLAAAQSARAESLETLPMPAAKSAEASMLASGGKGWLAISFGSNDTYRYTTDGTPAGTLKRSTFGLQRIRYFGLLGATPFFVQRDLASDSLCTADTADAPSCAPPAAVTEPGAPGLFPTAVRYPSVSAAFPLASTALYTSTAAFTNGMAGGDRRLGHVGVYTPPSTASSVHVLVPGAVTSPTTATMLGVAGGKALFQRSDDATKVYVVDGTSVTSRETTSTTPLQYVASPRGAARVIAFDGSKVIGMTATADEELGSSVTPGARHLFGSRVALLVGSASTVGLWLTDGTAAGTTKLAIAGATTGFQLTATSDRVFALLSDGVKLSIWTTNGTTAPTLVQFLAVGETATLLGARGATAYFGVSPIDGSTTKIYGTSGAAPTSIGSVIGRVAPFNNVVDFVDRSPTVGDAVIASLNSGGLLFIRGETSASDAGVEPTPDATADTAVVADAMVDTSVAPDTNVEDTALPVDDANVAADSAPVDSAAPPDSAPDATPAEESGGCGCRVAGGERGAPFALILLALLLRRRRAA